MCNRRKSTISIYFKTMVIRKFNELTEKYQKLQGKYNELTANYINMKKEIEENQDGGVGRHTAPSHTTRTDRKLNGKEIRHQGNKK